MPEETTTLKYEVKRTNDRISIKLSNGDNHAIFTVPAKELIDFLNALDTSIAEAMAWTLQSANREPSDASR